MKQNEVLIDQPNYLGFAILELSNLIMYETYYDKSQASFGLENLQLQYMNCDIFVLSFETRNVFSDLKNLQNFFGFSNLDQRHELFGKRTKKAVGRFKIETPESIWIGEIVCLRSKT